MEENMNGEVIKAVTDTLADKLPAVLDVALESKMAPLKEALVKDMDAVKAELKNISFATKQANPEVKDLFVKTAMVNIVKQVWNTNVTNESQFKDIVDSEIKTMNEWTATEGAELVFDQFEKNILMVINSYPVAGLVKKLNIKGKSLIIPKGTNTVVANWYGETLAVTPSDATTSNLTWNIGKIVALVNMSEEILEDNMTIPDLYDMIVEFIGEASAELIEDGILNGTITATAKIEGLFVNSDVNQYVLGNSTTSGQDAVSKITEDDLINAEALVLMKFKRKNSQLKWIGSQYTLSVLKTLRTTTGAILIPSLRETIPTINGREFIISDKAPVQNVGEDAATTDFLVFGDLASYYLMVNRRGMTLERGRYGNQFAEGVEALKGNMRTSGQPTYGEGFVKLTTSTN